MQWAGVAAGALVVVFAYLYLAVSQTRQLDPISLLPISAFSGGVVAGTLSRGGARAGAMLGFLAGVVGSAGLGLVLAAQSEAMLGTVTAAFAVVFALFGVLVLPAAVIGGAVGGSLKKSSGQSVTPSRPDL
jgi:hypothetical protein